jgi:activator-of-BECN1-regulated-autophagy protein 1
MISFIKSREHQFHSSLKLAHRLLEDLFLCGFSDSPIDYLASDETVLSTISISLSIDGELIATTHGDHTVKVFELKTCKLIQCFRGHPRTPWTVKFNPVNSNIIASGCLGCEARIWDVKQGICLNMIRFDSCIITLAFHPSGNFIMISSGKNLHTWDWHEG